MFKETGFLLHRGILTTKEFDYGEIYRETGKCPCAFSAEVIGKPLSEIYQQRIFCLSAGDYCGSFVPKITTDMLALYSVYSISRATAGNIGMEKQADSIGLLALAVFLVMIPLGVTGTEKDVTVVVAAALSTTYLGAAGLFTAMIFGLVVPVLYKFFIDKNLVIRMPDSVSPQIATSFQGILPSFIILLLAALLRFVFSLTAYGDINTCIYTLLKAPLAALGASPFTIFMTAIGVLPVMNGMEIPLGTPILLAGMLCGGWKLGCVASGSGVDTDCVLFPVF